ncbi:S-adenosyl-L-methionine-dependent methyltransferase [Stemphylium lycopersici]|nr:S-adenosyl-L-methionine-dependent methyltransferase [Stemphylium lycopersici]
MSGPNATLIECRFEYAVGSAIIALRFFTRWKTLGWRGFYWDDFFAFWSWVFFTMIYAMVEFLNIKGAPIALTQEQREALSPAMRKSMREGAKGMFASFYFLIFLVWSLKGCLIILFLRLTRSMLLYRYVQVIGGVSVAAFISAIVTQATHCLPLEKNWQILPDPGKECSAGIVINIVIAVGNVFKIRIVFLLSLGLFVMGMATARCILSIGTSVQVALASVWAQREADNRWCQYHRSGAVLYEEVKMDGRNTWLRKREDRENADIGTAITRSTNHEDTIKSLDSIQPTQFATDAERYEAKEAARRLLNRLETPFEQGWRLSFETPVLVAGIQTALDLGIWKKWTEADRKMPGAAVNLVQVLEWADKDVEPNLLRRFFRHLAALTDHTIPTGINLPRFLQKYNYREPIDLQALDNYRDMTNGTDFFALCAADPEGKGSSFMGLMTALRNHKMAWTDVYDTHRIISGANICAGKPLFVDIGGAHGLDTSRLLEKHPDLPADVLVLQDTPEVVAMPIENLDPRIVKQGYDFFTPQPQLNARAYFFHAVPHDWPDADCVRMFSQVKAAFKRGYSKLLIYEVVLPKKGATSLITTLDLQLMNCTSGMERTEEHWGSLLGAAGFRITGIWRHARAVESVIEAELA